MHRDRWRELRRICPSPGFLREPVTLFLAEELDEGEPDRAGAGKATLPEFQNSKTLVGVLFVLPERARI